MPHVQNVFNPMANVYQIQLEASRRFADALFSGTQKIDRVLLDATHRAFTEQMKFAQSLVTVRDAQGVANAQSTFFSHRPDRAMDYQRELIRVFTEVQNDLGKSMHNYMEQLGTAASATASGEPVRDVLNPVTGMFSVWESALREASSLANKNMDVARNTFEHTVEAVSDDAEAFEDAVDVGTAGHARKSSTGNHHKRK